MTGERQGGGADARRTVTYGVGVVLAGSVGWVLVLANAAGGVSEPRGEWLGLGLAAGALLGACVGAVWGRRLAPRLARGASREAPPPGAPATLRAAAGGAVVSPGTERVYRAVARFVHCDGRLDRQERAALDALRAELQIDPDTALRLEFESRGDGRLQIGDTPAEHGLLLERLSEVAARKVRFSPREQRCLEGIFATLGMPAASLGFLTPERRASTAV